MRALLLVLVTTLLGGCALSDVHSVQPLFGADDAREAPRLREGLWIVAFDEAASEQADDPCRVPIQAPPTRWPDCAFWVLARDGSIAVFDPDARTWFSSAYLIAPGGGAGPWSIWQDGPKPSGDLGASEYPYDYYAFEPLARDADGRVTGFALRGALCGPPNESAAGDKGGPATLAPSPGMTLSADGRDCLAADADAVRRAVDRARPAAGPGLVARWARAARPADFAPRRSP